MSRRLNPIDRTQAPIKGDEAAVPAEMLEDVAHADVGQDAEPIR